MANSRLKLSRRNFLGAGIGAVTMSNVPIARVGRELEKRIVTVTGSVRPEELGTTLPHEHVLIDFTDAHKDRRTRHEQDEAFEVILPKLERVRELGCQTLIECTPAYIGRNPLLLKRLSEASGLHLLTNTGYYGARGAVSSETRLSRGCRSACRPLAQGVAGWHRGNRHPARLYQDHRGRGAAE